MSRDVKKEYFRWLCNKVCTPEDKHNYSDILSDLFDARFDYILNLDKNVGENAKQLRNEFIETYPLWGCSERELRDLLASDYILLEVLVGLTNYYCEHLASDDSAHAFFWTMMTCSGLSEMTNRRYDSFVSQKAIDRIVQRQYDKSGKGGLFFTKNPNIDMRENDIHRQMHIFLGENGLI